MYVLTGQTAPTATVFFWHKLESKCQIRVGTIHPIGPNFNHDFHTNQLA
jgi:hypothetical protein